MVEIPVCWRRVNNDLLRDRIWALKEKKRRYSLSSILKRHEAVREAISEQVGPS